MKENEIPLRQVCRVRFKEPVSVRISRTDESLEVLGINLYFWRSSTGQLCYRLPGEFVGFLVPPVMLEHMEQVAVLDSGYDVPAQAGAKCVGPEPSDDGGEAGYPISKVALIGFIGGMLLMLAAMLYVVLSR